MHLGEAQTSPLTSARSLLSGVPSMKCVSHCTQCEGHRVKVTIHRDFRLGALSVKGWRYFMHVTSVNILGFMG